MNRLLKSIRGLFFFGTALLLSSCVGGVSEQLRLSETEIYFGAEGGTATVTSNIKCTLDNIKDNQGSVYTWEYNIMPSGRHRKTEWLEANGLTATDNDFHSITVSVSPSTEQREWTVRALAGDSGSREFKVYQNAGGH